MGLPTQPLPQDTVEVNGAVIRFRSLSRDEAFQLQEFRGREDDAEVFILVNAVIDPVSSEDEVRAWRKSTTAMAVGKLVDAILIFSELAEDPTGGPKGGSGRSTSTTRRAPTPST
jgi:hypothetical protein